MQRRDFLKGLGYATALCAVPGAVEVLETPVPFVGDPSWHWQERAVYVLQGSGLGSRAKDSFLPLPGSPRYVVEWVKSETP